MKRWLTIVATIGTLAVAPALAQHQPYAGQEDREIKALMNAHKDEARAIGAKRVESERAMEPTTSRLQTSGKVFVIGSSLETIRSAALDLERWLGHVFNGMGGFMVATGSI